MDVAIPTEAEKVLPDEQFHQSLIADIDNVARAANIPIDMIWAPMAQYCTQVEIDYVAALRRQSQSGNYGVVITAKRPQHSMITRFTAITGACVRNYVNARVMTLQDVLECIKASEMPTPTVLLLPNFYVGVKTGGRVAEWQTQGLLSMLYQRQAEGLQTFLYVSSMKELEDYYGAAFCQHLRENMVMIDEDQDD